jgi:hypothetical protein
MAAAVEPELVAHGGQGQGHVAVGAGFVGLGQVDPEFPGAVRQAHPDGPGVVEAFEQADLGKGDAAAAQHGEVAHADGLLRIRALDPRFVLAIGFDHACSVLHVRHTQAPLGANGYPESTAPSYPKAKQSVVMGQR